MKTLIWIALFKLITVYGSYPQINVSCSETDNWPDGPEENPSVLANLAVSLAEVHEDRSAISLNISWAINIDNSNEYLMGTAFSVNRKSFYCKYHPPFNKVNISGYEKLWFHYTEIPATPDTLYAVSAWNLPIPMIGNDIISKSEFFQMPDCSNKVMREHESCLQIVKESEWEPNITTIFVSGQVEVSFTSSKYSKEYDLQLWRCASPMECTDPGKYISGNKSFTEGTFRWTRTLNATGPCDSLQVMISPHFPSCANFCAKKSATVDCNPREPSNWTFLLCFTSIPMVLVSVAVFMWYEAYKTRSAFGVITPATPLVSVLVVYPAGNRAFQRAVVTFAEFLQSQWHCKVAIDVWERGKIAKQGPLRWLSMQTECVDKVVIVCRQRAEPWESTAGLGQLTDLRDHTVPASAEDVFSLALNMLESQIQCLPSLQKYCAVHLGGRPDAKCLPTALKVCKCFSLMKDVEKLGRHLHNTGREACCFPSVGLKPGPLNGDATGRLRDAIWQLDSGSHDKQVTSLIAVKTHL